MIHVKKNLDIISQSGILFNDDKSILQWLATLLRPATELLFLVSMEEANKVTVFLTSWEKSPKPRHCQSDCRLHCLTIHLVWEKRNIKLACFKNPNYQKLWNLKRAGCETQMVMVNYSNNWLFVKAAGALMTVCEVTALMHLWRLQAAGFEPDKGTGL